MLQLIFKDLKLFFRDKRNLMLSFALPIALISLFALAFGGAGKGSGNTKITLLYSDLDQTYASKQAFLIFDSLPNIHLKTMKLTAAQQAVEKGNESALLIVHQGFADSLNNGAQLPLEIQYDEAKKIEVGLLQQALIPSLFTLPFVIGNPKQSMAKRFFKMTPNADSLIQNNIQNQSNKLFDAISEGVKIENEKNGNTLNATNFLSSDIKITKLIKAKKDNQLGLIQAVAGTAIMMLLFSVVGIGAGLLEEKQEGTLKRLLYTPLNPIKILFAKMITTNLISLMQLFIMFIFAWLVFGLDIIAHFPALLISILATSFACSSFGVFLASIAQTRQQVQGLSTLIILVMSALGGSMMPIFFMPELMQKLAVISVNYWSIQSFYDVFWRDFHITDQAYLKKIFILILIGTALNFIAFRLFKRNILRIS